MDHNHARYINAFIFFFFSLSCLLFLFLLDFPPFFLPRHRFAASDLFSIPRLIFVVARDIRPLSDSVFPYRAIYPASMANGRYIDNGDLYTLFTHCRARAYYVSPRQCVATRSRLISVTVSLLGTFT